MVFLSFRWYGHGPVGLGACGPVGLWACGPAVPAAPAGLAWAESWGQGAACTMCVLESAPPTTHGLDAAAAAFSGGGPAPQSRPRLQLWCAQRTEHHTHTHNRQLQPLAVVVNLVLRGCVAVWHKMIYILKVRLRLFGSR